MSPTRLKSEQPPGRGDNDSLVRVCPEIAFALLIMDDFTKKLLEDGNHLSDGAFNSLEKPNLRNHLQGANGCEKLSRLSNVSIAAGYQKSNCRDEIIPILAYLATHLFSATLAR